MFEFRPDKSNNEKSFRFPSSFEFTFECVLPEDSPLLDWIKETPDPKKTLKKIEELMKKYNISKDRMVAEYHMLKWLFLDSETNFGEGK